MLCSFLKKLKIELLYNLDFPGGSDGTESACGRFSCGRPEFNPWVGKILWRREWHPTPVFLPGESHGQRSLVGYSPWGRKESDTTEQLSLLLVHIRPLLCLCWLNEWWFISSPYLSWNSALQPLACLFPVEGQIRSQTESLQGCQSHSPPSSCDRPGLWGRVWALGSDYLGSDLLLMSCVILISCWVPLCFHMCTKGMLLACLMGLLS